MLEEDLDGFWDMIYFQVRFVCDLLDGFITASPSLVVHHTRSELGETD